MKSSNLVEIPNGLKVSKEYYEFIKARATEQGKDIGDVVGILRNLLSNFGEGRNKLLAERARKQNVVNTEFPNLAAERSKLTPEQFDAKKIAILKKAGYVSQRDRNVKPEGIKLKPGIAPELQMGGMQGIGPGDKASMMVRLINSRYTDRTKALAEAAKKDPAILAQGLTSGEFTPIQYCLNDLHRIFGIDFAAKQLRVIDCELQVGNNTLRSPAFEGYIHEGNVVKEIILKHNGLHIRLPLDAEGKIESVISETNISAIVDREDSSTPTAQSFNASNKIIASLVKGNLEAYSESDKQTVKQNPQFIEYTKANGVEKGQLKTNAHWFVRANGLHVNADKSVITFNGEEVPAFIVDVFTDVLSGVRDFVAPKMHSAYEARLYNAMLGAIEDALGLERNSIGIFPMTEEFGASGNLYEFLNEFSGRLIMTNTGFLDYTGSTIDAFTALGPVAPIRNLAGAPYIKAYEHNAIKTCVENLGVEVPVGGGMWPNVDQYKNGLVSKTAQVDMGYVCSWSPKPEHGAVYSQVYHDQNVAQVHAKHLSGKKRLNDGTVEDMCSLPVYADKAALLASIGNDQSKIINNINYAAHGAMVYFAPWIQKNIGCSARTDLDDVMKMEDCATARIKVAFLANWLSHGVMSPEQFVASVKEMAKLVDDQHIRYGVKGFDKLYDKSLEQIKTLDDLAVAAKNFTIPLPVAALVESVLGIQGYRAKDGTQIFEDKGDSCVQGPLLRARYEQIDRDKSRSQGGDGDNQSFQDQLAAQRAAEDAQKELTAKL